MNSDKQLDVIALIRKSNGDGVCSLFTVFLCFILYKYTEVIPLSKHIIMFSNLVTNRKTNP